MKIRIYEPFLETDDEDINFNTHFFDQTYILVSFLYEGYSDNNQTSIDVFRYVLNDTDITMSTIIQHAPLDFSVVDSWEQTLNIADFDAEEDHIFVLDERYGFIKFWLWADEVMDVSNHMPVFGGLVDFVAMAATFIDEEYYFTFITTDTLYEYKIIDIDKDSDDDFIFQF